MPQRKPLMLPRTRVPHFALAVAIAFLPGSIDSAAAQFRDLEHRSDSVFGMTRVWEIHLQFEPDQWKLLQPPEDVNWNVEGAFGDVIRDATTGKHFHSQKSSRPGLAGYMGVDHQYGMADVTIADDTIRGVGVRYKGNGTFLAGRETGKYSFKIDFNEYDALEFRGLTKINLQNCATDPSMMREALSYEVFRAFEMLGSPESRRDLSIDHPQIGDDHRLIERILAIPDYRKAYRDRIAGLMETVFDEDRMIARIEQAGDFLRPLVAAEGDVALKRFESALGEKPETGSPHVLKFFVRRSCCCIRSRR